jgi:hypothetical protein
MLGKRPLPAILPLLMVSLAGLGFVTTAPCVMDSLGFRPVPFEIAAASAPTLMFCLSGNRSSVPGPRFWPRRITHGGRCVDGTT